jgi:transposase-like protein
VLPGVEHRTSKKLNNGLERNHGHRTQRIQSMRGFEQSTAADRVARGHALIQTLRTGAWRARGRKEWPQSCCNHPLVTAIS